MSDTDLIQKHHREFSCAVHSQPMASGISISVAFVQDQVNVLTLLDYQP